MIKDKKIWVVLVVILAVYLYNPAIFQLEAAVQPSYTVDLNENKATLCSQTKEGRCYDKEQQSTEDPNTVEECKQISTINACGCRDSGVWSAEGARNEGEWVIRRNNLINTQGGVSVRLLNCNNPVGSSGQSCIITCTVEGGAPPIPPIISTTEGTTTPITPNVSNVSTSEGTAAEPTSQPIPKSSFFKNIFSGRDCYLEGEKIRCPDIPSLAPFGTYADTATLQHGKLTEGEFVKKTIREVENNPTSFFSKVFSGALDTLIPDMFKYLVVGLNKIAPILSVFIPTTPLGISLTVGTIGLGLIFLVPGAVIGGIIAATLGIVGTILFALNPGLNVPFTDYQYTFPNVEFDEQVRLQLATTVFCSFECDPTIGGGLAVFDSPDKVNSQATCAAWGDSRLNAREYFKSSTSITYNPDGCVISRDMDKDGEFDVFEFFDASGMPVIVEGTPPENPKQDDPKTPSVLGTLGNLCTENGGCTEGSCREQNGEKRCVKPETPKPGDVGTFGTACRATSPSCDGTLQCVNNTCSKPEAKPGKESGPCLTKSLCSEGLVCDANDICQKLKEPLSGDLGSACTPSSNCTTTLTCDMLDKSNGVCIKDKKAASEGGPCIPVELALALGKDEVCENGLACKSGTCKANVAPPNPTDTDGDGKPNHLDPDDDNDGIPDDGDASGSVLDNLCKLGRTKACDDNCQYVSNPEQENMDKDNLGDACDMDIDGDGVFNPNFIGTTVRCSSGEEQTCKTLPTPENNYQGDCTCADNCWKAPNSGQEDSDGDSLGDLCDTPTVDEVCELGTDRQMAEHLRTYGCTVGKQCLGETGVCHAFSNACKQRIGKLDKPDLDRYNGVCTQQEQTFSIIRILADALGVNEDRAKSILLIVGGIFFVVFVLAPKRFMTRFKFWRKN